MKAPIVAAIAITVSAVAVPAAHAGNTSSNSSSNTSSDSGSHGASYRHTHNWSVNSDDGRRRRVIRGSTTIDRYTPNYRTDRPRRFRIERDDD